MFFGREDVFDWIQKSLTGRYADHILVIHGQRRVGKTSVLKQLGNRLPEKYIPVFFDLQGRTRTTLDRFLWWLAREIVRVLKQERDISVPAPEKEVFTDDPEYFEIHFLPSLRPVLGERSLLLTFDEFDNLEESEVKEDLARPLIDYLRRMMGEQGLNFIFSIGSSGRKLENMQASYTEFFKTALYKKISFLSKEQTFGLVTRPVEGLLEYEREAVERIYRLASGHPYFTQLTCHEVFSLCQRTGELRIREADVESVLDDVVERGTVNLKFTWDEASDIEKWSLAALAHAPDRLDNPALAEFLRKQRVRFSDSDLTSGVLRLREKDILTEENHFVIHLLKLWLKMNRSLEQAREELTEVNPIANRYIEIGLEFHDSGQYDKAIENFREALAVAPEHIQAQVNTALSYMAQKNLDQAVVEFEKALAIDDEDVTARSGLCGAHLALGEAAREKGKIKDAVLSYQKVLSINAEHTEARQRMAEISRQRAEKALTEGRDEEALSAFSEALKFTPEDEALSTRYEQAKVEKRTKVLVSLLAKAEKEQSARNWGAALSILNNALELDPESEKARTRLAAVQAEQRKEQLQSILARAERAAQAGRWELVIAALEEYLALEPGDAKVQARIEEARRKLHEAQVDEAYTHARNLARQERWEEAAAVWGEVLKLAPEEGKTVQAEIEKIKQAQALVKTYLEAQTAFTKKNYERATALFKEIVVQDENYRDASRRMADAIKLRRTAHKFWQTRWLLAGAGSIVVVGLATLALLPISPVRRLLAAQPAHPVIAPVLENAATATPTLALFENKISPKDSMIMVFVPAGVFEMGSEDGKDDKKPIHTVYLDAYWIDQSEVTNAMYELCVQADVCDPLKDTSSYTRSSYYGNVLYDDYPVIYVDWNMAKTYCEWAGARLPTEAEWEKAARGTDDRVYPWGNSFNGNIVNFCDTNCPFDWKDTSSNDGYKDTAPVGSYTGGKSPYGLFDMAGNVWEWVADWYDASYYSSTPTSNPQGPSSGHYRVLRGGAWDYTEYFVRASDRIWIEPSYFYFEFGFRCSRSLP